MPYQSMMKDIAKPNIPYRVYSKFRDLNGPEENIERESFTVILTDSLLVYENKYYHQVYLGNCAYKIVDKQITDYLDYNLFEEQIL